MTTIADIYPLVVIIWRDHTASLPAVWANKEDMEAQSQLDTISSVGWLYKETDEDYTIFACADADLEQFGEIQTIGKAMTIELKIIKGKKNARKRSRVD